MKRQNIDVNGEKIVYWRSIDNRRRTKEYIKSIEDEFAPDISDITDIDRRSMLKVMGASIALSGLGISCRRPEEKILPYVKQPEGITPGIPNFFATAQPSPFGATGLLVESHEGRPTKIEGNPSHPASVGKASIFNQASILELYDPDRSRYCTTIKQGARLPAEWVEWDVFLAQKIIDLSKTGGEGLAFLVDSDLSPTFLRLKNAVLARFSKAKFYVHDPLRGKNREQGCVIAFGKHTRVRYNFAQAKVICSLFADPFAAGPEHVLNMNGFAQGRKIYDAKDASLMNRLYAVEADYSLAGTNADHRLRLPVGLAKTFLEGLIYELHATHGIDIDKKYLGAQTLAKLMPTPPSLRGVDKKFVRVCAKDLAKNVGHALIVGGEHLSPPLQAMIHALNVALNGLGSVFEVLSIDDTDAQKHLAEDDVDVLVKELNAGLINTLVMMGVNPVYTAPRSLEFNEAMAKAQTSIHAGLYEDETARLASWHLPLTHFLEHFSDTRAFDGSISIIQPLIKPLHGARSALQLMAQWAGMDASKPLNHLVKETFNNMSQASFNKAIHDGLIENSQFSKAQPITINSTTIFDAFAQTQSRAPSLENFELLLRFDRKVLDGRYANHSWLQELPDQVIKMNWDNALLMSPAAAKALKIKSGVKKNAYVADIVQIEASGLKLEAPVFVLPGLSEFSLVLSLGYGRTHAGEIGNGVGIDAIPLVSDYSKLVSHGIKISRLGKTVRLSTTQEQFAMNGDIVQEQDVLSLQGREPSRAADINFYKKNPDYIKENGLPDNLLTTEPGKKEKVPLQITKPWDYTTGNQWGMVIDLAKCTGCNACVLACQSENNIPVVGKEQVIRGRMMHWIRVDRFFVGDVNDPKSISQPIPCQHCENAPCEPVCPVAATAHDKEGLNAMTYNRCIGTRYCANNCPFKVRRFNYFDFSNTGNLYVEPKTVERQKTLKLQRNPDVTVRYRGVMEKCTFCTQRIQEAKMVARRENRDPNHLPDGAVTPACAQTCPAEAITFGNIIDEESRVYKLKSLTRNYTMLDILNVRPRTSYLSKLRNPHPDLVA